MATLVKADGTKFEVTPVGRKKFTLEEMQSLVGRNVELVAATPTYKFFANNVGQDSNLPVKIVGSIPAVILVVEHDEVE